MAFQSLVSSSEGNQFTISCFILAASVGQKTQASIIHGHPLGAFTVTNTSSQRNHGITWKDRSTPAAPKSEQGLYIQNQSP